MRGYEKDLTGHCWPLEDGRGPPQAGKGKKIDPSLESPERKAALPTY